MRRRNDITATGAFAGMRRNISWGIWAVLLSFFFGCATAPKPVIIHHERTPSQSGAALSGKQSRKEPTDQKIAASETTLSGGQSRKESADQKIAPSETALSGGQSRKEPADQRIAAMVELLKNKNLINADEAALITGQTETSAVADKKPAVAADANAAREELKKEIGEQVRSEVLDEMLRDIWKINRALAEKDKRLRFTGDIRLRYESDRFDKNNIQLFQPLNPTQLMNTQNDQSRFKYRVRFGAEAQVNDQMEAVIRLSTGSTSNPVSTNSTIGDYMNKDSVLFDLAYLRWQPWKSLTLYGGRMPNPFFSSDLVWDTDLNFEGFALQTKTPHAESWTPFLTTGVFPLQQDEVNFSQHGKWLLAGQIGVERKNQKGVTTKVGVAYYDFKNITGIENDPLDASQRNNWTAPLFMQKGNTLFNINPNATSQADLKMALASEFKELNVTATLDIGFWDPVHIVFLGDYVKNLGFNQADVAQRTGNPDIPEEVGGYQYGLSIGYPATYESGQWKVYFYKKRLEADAVVDAFTDSDFHLGGTNAKGWILGTDLGLAKNTWLALRWLTADEISGPPLAIDVLLVDVNARF
jgi:hypothetical protein